MVGVAVPFRQHFLWGCLDSLSQTTSLKLLGPLPPPKKKTKTKKQWTKSEEFLVLGGGFLGPPQTSAPPLAKS